MDNIAEELRQRTFRTTSNYWSACRGRSGAEFVARLGVAEDEAAESVLWLMLVAQSEIRKDAEAKGLLAEGREITAILSKSHKTAREDRKRKKNQKKTRLTNLPTN